MKLYIYKDNQQIGPLDESVVEAKLQDKSFSAKDLGCREGEKNWQTLDTLFPLSESTHTWMRDSGNLQANQPPPAFQHQPAPFQQTKDATSFSPQQPYTQPAPVSVQHIVHHLAVEPEGSLPTVALVAGIVLFCLFLLGLVPCLGWLNWFVLLGGGVVKILCWVSVFTNRNPSGRNKAIIGLILTTIALFFGAIRLILGGGCI